MATPKFYCQKCGTVLQHTATTADNTQAQGYCPTCSNMAMGKLTAPKPPVTESDTALPQASEEPEVESYPPDAEAEKRARRQAAFDAIRSDVGAVMRAVWAKYYHDPAKGNLTVDTNPLLWRGLLVDKLMAEEGLE